MTPAASSVFICLSVCPPSFRIPLVPEAQGNPARETPRGGEIVRQDLPKAEQLAAAPSQTGPGERWKQSSAWGKRRGENQPPPPWIAVTSTNSSKRRSWDFLGSCPRAVFFSRCSFFAPFQVT
ncbi:hypothetical protein E2320_017395 [Naja naja]|nr:hypothetical protein E2320_017395 [Naja naja]